MSRFGIQRQRPGDPVMILVSLPSAAEAMTGRGFETPESIVPFVGQSEV
jgi:hypothetical protein